MPLTNEELQLVVDLVDARLRREYNYQFQIISEKLTKLLEEDN